ncbi:unnamed protein product [Echinostoma caproni]|uniref:Peptidase A2 domain-containing protein n=1 Tax=Echinostoma caproni TaxID=27848 RepID=A0A183AS88_9TREM|nr:unnamed protein product [Echinostoma caproni]
MKSQDEFSDLDSSVDDFSVPSPNSKCMDYLRKIPAQSKGRNYEPRESERPVSAAASLPKIELARLLGPLGSVVTYAFLDSGSDTTLMSANVARSLGLFGAPVQMHDTPVGGTNVQNSTEITVDVESLDGSYCAKIDDVHTVDVLREKSMRPVRGSTERMATP